MQNYHVKLEAETDEKNYYVARACNSVDLNINKKLTHEIKIDVDLETDYNVGLIIGLSGSGKTTLAKHLFPNFNKININKKECILKQFPEDMSYDERADILTKFGLSSVTEWIKPFEILSNGEKSRAEIALTAGKHDFFVVDEFTSVVDRTVAKIMSNSISKIIKQQKKKIVLISVHKDIIEWVDPDWIIDVDNQIFINRRLLQQRRKEKLVFNIKECSRKSWKYFSKYHYLSDNLPGGKIHLFGLFDENNIQIGFQCFANYVPGKNKIIHSNRTVIHPEYVGVGLGIKLINITSQIMADRGYDVRAKFSNFAIYKSMIKNKSWKFLNKSPNTQKSQYHVGDSMQNKTGQRKSVTTYQFKFIGNLLHE